MNEILIHPTSHMLGHTKMNMIFKFLKDILLKKIHDWNQKQLTINGK